jgi:hypothetical protein
VISLTPAFRLYAKRRRKKLAEQDPVATQKRELLKLIGRAKNTRFGRDHEFKSVRSVADFQNAVPLRRYEAHWSEYWKSDYPNLVDVTWPGTIPFFAVTSGTTSGTSKNIPVTHEMNRANTRGGLDVLLHHLVKRPQSRAVDGRNFFLGGSVVLRECAPGVYSGDLSGIAVRQTPAWYRPFTFPPADVASEPDWERKIDQIVDLVAGNNIRILGGTPSWLLYLIERQQNRAGASLTARELYPHLELLVHGGLNFKPYRERFEAFLGGKAETREVYPASEGFIASQDESPEAGLRLMTDNGLFFEFVPVEELQNANPTRHTVADAEPGVNYAIVLSTCAGCWAYVLGDTVRFVSHNPPRILVTGRTSYFMSAFGEHLIDEEIEDAVAAGASAIETPISDFSLGAVFPKTPNESGHHLYVVEFICYPIDENEITRFREVLEEVLCARNDDYRIERMEYGVIGAPKIYPVPTGTFASWMKSRGKLGGQNKVPRVINDAELFANLEQFTRDAIARKHN